LATSITYAARTRPTSHTEPDDALWAFRLSSAAFFGLLVTVLGVAAWRGPFAYAMDDAYIHLALARNVAFHGTWGLVPGIFQSASSSPGWTVLLAGVLRVWPFPDEWLPLALNVAAASWLLWSVSSMATRWSASRFGRGRALLVCLAVSIGLVPLVLTGMEHTLHAAIVAQLLVLLQRRSFGQWTERERSAWYALLVIGVFVRLETLIVGAAACLAVLVLERSRKDRRRFSLAATGLALIAPLSVIAAFDLFAGAYALPNSVMAKSVMTNGTLFDVGRIATNIRVDPGLAVLGLLCLLVAIHADRSRRPERGLGAFTMALTIVGLEFSGAIGILGRYEAFAYLGALAVVGAYLLTGAIDLRGLWPRRLGVALAVIALAPPVGLLLGSPVAMGNINSQQATMGQFLAEYYDGQAVAVNDIGEVAYRHRGDLVDFEGLGSLDVLQHRRDGDFNADTIAADLAAHDVKVVAVFERFYEAVLPPHLIRVGRWCMNDHVLVNADRCVTFFAPSPTEAVQLRTNLQAFQPDLPSSENLQLS
jgi:hypothetical protein